MSETIEEGSQVLLYQDARRSWVTSVSRKKFHTHRGYLDLSEVIGRKYGESVKTSMGQNLTLFKPRAIDLVEVFDRPTQILYPKDIGYSLYQLGVKSGDRVLEVGTGSGAMTASLAQAVKPTGHVYSYEMRPEFLEAARSNIEKAGMSEWVTLHHKSPMDGFDEDGASAVVVDLGDPWLIVAPAWKALVGGGMLAGFTPTTNQLEKLAVALRDGGFIILEAVEVFLRIPESRWQEIAAGSAKPIDCVPAYFEKVCRFA